MAVKAGEAFLELSVHDAAFKAGLAQGLQRFRTFAGALTVVGAALTAVGGAMTGVFTAAATTFANIGDHLEKMSRRTGVGVATLSQLTYAARQSGVDMTTLEEVIKIMQQRLIGLGRGGKQAQRVFTGLGIDANKLRQQLPDEQLQTLLSALGGIENPTTRAAAAMALFGRSGTAILPLIGHWKELTKEAEHFQLTVSAESARRAEKLHSAFDLLVDTFKALGSAIGDAFSGQLTASLRAVAESIATITKWVKANKELIATTATASKVILGLGLAFVLIGGAMPAVIPGLTAITETLKELGGDAISLVETAFGALVSVIGSLFTPLGLVVGAIVAIGAAFLYFSGIGGKIVAYLGEQFGVIKTIAEETFQGVSDALAGGDIAAAANVLWAGLKLAWLRGTEDLRVAWVKFSADALEIITKLAGPILTAWSAIVLGIKSLWAGLVAEAKSVGERIGHYLSRHEVETVADLDKKIAELKAIQAQPNNDFASQLAGEETLKDLEARRKAAKILGEQGQRELQQEQDRAHSQRLQQIKEEGDAEQARIQKELAERLAAIQAGQNAGGGDQAKAIQDALDATRRAQEKFDEARRHAADAKKRAFAQPPADDKFKGGLEGIADAAKGLTRSTFSGALAAQVFGGGGDIDQTPKLQLTQQKQTNEKLDDILDAIENGGLIAGNA